MFRIDKLNQKAQEALQQTQALAESNESQVMYPIHLLAALVEERDGIVRPILEKCGVHPDAIATEARRLFVTIPKTAATQPGIQVGMYLAPPLNQVLERAFDEATRFKDEFV